MNYKHYRHLYTKNYLAGDHADGCGDGSGSGRGRDSKDGSGSASGYGDNNNCGFGSGSGYSCGAGFHEFNGYGFDLRKAMEMNIDNIFESPNLTFLI